MVGSLKQVFIFPEEKVSRVERRVNIFYGRSESVGPQQL
jgi:hypothetical protein